MTSASSQILTSSSPVSGSALPSMRAMQSPTDLPAAMACANLVCTSEYLRKRAVTFNNAQRICPSAFFCVNLTPHKHVVNLKPHESIISTPKGIHVTNGKSIVAPPEAPSRSRQAAGCHSALLPPVHTTQEIFLSLMSQAKNARTDRK